MVLINFRENFEADHKFTTKRYLKTKLKNEVALRKISFNYFKK